MLMNARNQIDIHPIPSLFLDEGDDFLRVGIHGSSMALVKKAPEKRKDLITG